MSGNISKTYSLKEAAKILGVTYRTVRYYKDIYSSEVYQDGRSIEVTERFIDLIKNNRQVNENRISDKKTKKEYREELEALQDQLQKEREKVKDMEDQIKKFEGLDYDQENERLEVFTNEEYEMLEKALQEWKVQKVKIQHQEESFKVQLASKDELVEHYRNQSDYQKKQADRILDQMEKLIEAIRRRDTIEAVEKNVIGKKLDME